MNPKVSASRFAQWQLGQDALDAAVERLILAHWVSSGASDPAREIDDPGVAELYRVYHDLTGWIPSREVREAAKPS